MGGLPTSRWTGARSRSPRCLAHGSEGRRARGRARRGIRPALGAAGGSAIARRGRPRRRTRAAGPSWRAKSVGRAGSRPPSRRVADERHRRNPSPTWTPSTGSWSDSTSRGWSRASGPRGRGPGRRPRGSATWTRPADLPRRSLPDPQVTKSFTVDADLPARPPGAPLPDDPIARYVPGIPDGDRITLAQLAGMQSGVKNSHGGSGVPRRHSCADLGRPWTPRELVDFTIPESPVFAPAAQFDYSDTNTILLGIGRRAGHRPAHRRRRTGPASSGRSGSRGRRTRTTRASPGPTRRPTWSAARWRRIRGRARACSSRCRGVSATGFPSASG